VSVSVSEGVGGAGVFLLCFRARRCLRLGRGAASVVSSELELASGVCRAGRVGARFFSAPVTAGIGAGTGVGLATCARVHVSDIFTVDSRGCLDFTLEKLAVALLYTRSIVKFRCATVPSAVQPHGRVIVDW
jgi:hypothetical protein